MNERIIMLEADFLKAIAHPTRLRIIEHLRDGEKCVCKFTEDLELEQSNISQHLAVLRKQGVVSCRKEGMNMMYKINFPEIYSILDLVRKVLVSQVEATATLLKNNQERGE